MSDFSSLQFSACLRTSASIDTGTYRQRVFPSTLSVSVQRLALPTVWTLSVPDTTLSRSRSVRTRETVALQPASCVVFFIVGNYTDYFGGSQGQNAKNSEKSFRGGSACRAAAPMPTG